MAELFERAWPVADAKAGIALVHGFGEHSGRYEYVAQALNSAGYAVYAQDVRGHGQSVGFPGKMGTIDQVLADTTAQCLRVHAAHPKTFLLGHSMGSLIALGAIVELPQDSIAGLVLTGAPIAPGPAVLEALSDPKGFAVAPELVSRDPEIVKAYANDPLVFHEPVAPDALAGVLEGTARAVGAIPLVVVPTLIVHGTQDKLAALSGAEELHTQLVVTDKTLKVYPGLEHEVLNEPERDEVIAYIVRWLDAH